MPAAYVPPRKHAGTRNRAEVFQGIVETVKEIRKKQSSGWLQQHLIRVAADFNFGTKDLMDAEPVVRDFISAMEKEGLVPALPPDTATHRGGGHLQDIFYPQGERARVTIRN